MLSKKLLTLACLVGILAFGGCLLIPDGPARPPAPPRVTFQGIRMIEVTATNVSEAHHLDPGELAVAVVKEINDQAKNTTMRAEVQKDGAEGDAVLKITLLSETAVPVTSRSQSSSAQTARWNFRCTLSSSLTKADGEVVWSETNRTYLASPSTRTNPEVVWNDPKRRRSFISTISGNFVIRLFYGR